MSRLPVRAEIRLPAWIKKRGFASAYNNDEERMALAIEMARTNVEEGSGGPFGAAVFEADSGRLLAVGVNQVVRIGTSVAHAEIMAMMLAQLNEGRYRLNSGGARIVLASSAQPCAMCFGALLWAGIDRLLIGAAREDVEGMAGFDEGPLPPDWPHELDRRGIQLRTGLLRAEAAEVLRHYHEKDGIRY